jgi:hypothetical protein
MSDKPVLKAADFTSTHLKKAEINKSGGVDPAALAHYKKIFNENGGNYEKMAAALKVTFTGKVLPKTADDFATSFLQGRLTKD